MNAAELDFYDEDIDVEDVQDAQDVGMDDESGMMADDNEDMMTATNPDDEEGR